MKKVEATRCLCDEDHGSLDRCAYGNYLAVLKSGPSLIDGMTGTDDARKHSFLAGFIAGAFFGGTLRERFPDVGPEAVERLWHAGIDDVSGALADLEMRYQPPETN